jgi:hypothetical protein
MIRCVYYEIYLQICFILFTFVWTFYMSDKKLLDSSQRMIYVSHKERFLC